MIERKYHIVLWIQHKKKKLLPGIPQLNTTRFSLTKSENETISSNNSIFFKKVQLQTLAGLSHGYPVVCFAV